MSASCTDALITLIKISFLLLSHSESYPWGLMMKLEESSNEEDATQNVGKFVAELRRAMDS